MASQYIDIVLKVQEESPGYRVVPKSQSRLMKFLSIISKPFNPYFMQQYTITIGNTTYIPDQYIGTQQGYEILAHERIHVLDYKKWKSLFFLTYLFIFPTIITLRALWEYRGYKETLRVTWEDQGKPLNPDGSPWVDPNMLDFVISQFTTSSYLFMFPFSFILRKLFVKNSKYWK